MSLVLHGIVFGGMILFSHHSEKLQNKTVSVDFLSPEEMQKLLAQQNKAAEKMKQIVEQDEKNANNILDENAKFLSAKNQKVAKETVAQNKGDFQNSKNTQKTIGSTASPAAGSTAKAKATKTAEAQNQPLKNLFSNYDPAAAFEKQQKIAAQQATQTEQGQNGQASAAQGSADVSQTNDYTKNVDKGLETLLNTREFKYYSYYNRIRRQLAQHWEGKVREKLTKMFKERRAPANLNDDKITKVIVILNSAGTLVTVQVVSDSGVRDLDDAAIEAFRAAAPFPNPPRGIIEQDGTVKIRWDFVLES